jgi:hypothetical protein
MSEGYGTPHPILTGVFLLIVLSVGVRQALLQLQQKI